MSLGAYIARRVFWTIPVVFGVMLVTFGLLRGAGGDPFRPPEDSPACLRATRGCCAGTTT